MPVFCHKLPVYAPHREPRLQSWFSNEPQIPHWSRHMSRRQLSLLVLAVASFVVTACGSSPTAPSHDEPIVVMTGTG